MEPLKITAKLLSPIITGASAYMTLDGILGSVLFDQLQDVDQAHASIPIKQTNSLFHASAMIVEPIAEGKTAFIAGLYATHSIDPDLIKKNKKNQIHANVFTSTFTNVMNSYRTITAPDATWYVVGDSERIKALLNDVQFIGKRRASGFGRVQSWTIESADTDGLLSFDQPLRPIPVPMFKGDKSLPIVDAAWRPAYWNLNNRAPCYAPSLVA